MPATSCIEVREREIIGTRIFTAPRALVWRAFTDPDHLQHWWGPKGFTNTFHEFDFRPGGRWRFVMHGPDGTDYPNENIFVEIAFLERIVFDHLSQPEFRLTASFEEVDGKTKLTWRQRFESVEVCDSVKPFAVPGLEQNLDKLAAHLPTINPMRRELTIRRIFDAPRGLVWKAWTDPEHLAKWWGPNGFTCPVCEVDARPGGAIYIVMRAPNGMEYPMRGVFREVVAPERLVFTNFPVDASDLPMIDGLTAVTFAERDGKTEMTLQTRAIGRIPAAAYMIAGMAEGWGQSMERLTEFVAATKTSS
ncbi:MAG: SRPBCC domain-containing protein [Methylovirgula sp.]